MQEAPDPQLNALPIKEHPDLYRRATKGGYWVIATQFVTKGLGFLKSIIVFNFLFRENLELIIVANLLMAVLTTFSESGIHGALVQKKENIEDYLDTAWVVGILRGILLFATMYMLAPLFVSFRVKAEMTDLAISIIRVMGACFLLGSFQNIGILYFHREMQFYKTFWLSIAGTLTDIVLSIVLVVVYKSVWGYVAAKLCATIVNLVMTYLLCPFRPKLKFVPEKARELWKFGRWLFGARIIGYLLNEGDGWFVWFYLGGDPLKIYRYACQFANMPTSHIADTISAVGFPAYSKIQDDPARLTDAHKKTLQMTAILSIPVAFLIMVLGPDFVRLFLVKQSHQMIPVVQILAISSLFMSLGSSFSALYKAIKKPYLGFFSQGARLVLMPFLIFPFTYYWGIVGTALSMMILRVMFFPLGFFLGCRALKCSLWFLAKPLFFCILAGGIMGAAVAALKRFLIGDVSVPVFFALAFAAGIIYLATLYIIDARFKLGYRSICTEQITWMMQKVKRPTDNPII